LGYLVFCRNKYDAKIVDLFGLSCPGMWTALLAQLLERLRAQEVVTLGASALASSPWKGVLKKLGFHPRESAPVVVCRAADTITNENGPWYLMDGDRES
jgi:hypothetical protein